MSYGKVLECLVVVGCVTLAEAASWSDEVKDVKKGASVFVREPLDLSFADGVEMDVTCSNFDALGPFTGCLHNGKTGWYMMKTRQVPPVRDGRMRLRFLKAEVYNVEGKAAGWGAADYLKLSVKNVMRPLKIGVSDYRAYVAGPREVAVLVPEHGLPRTPGGMLARASVNVLTSLPIRYAQFGVTAYLLSELDCVAKGKLPEETRILHVPYFKMLSDEAKAFVTAYEKAGGKVLKRLPKDETDLRETVLKLVPAFSANADAAAARQAARQTEIRAEVARMPSRPDEERFVCCHTAWGSKANPDRGWAETARLVKAANFHRLDVNFCRGLYASYASEVLRSWPHAKDRARGDALAECLAACRRHRLRLYAWRCCWAIPEWLAPKADVEALGKEGRLAVARSGRVMSAQLCPTHPDNIRTEVESMVELAGKGVDGIEFDYMRYRDAESCFCPRCLDAFGKRVGRVFAKEDWKPLLAKDGPLEREWLEFRKDNISHVVREVSKRVRARYPQVRISVFGFHAPCIHADQVGQDWPRWCREGWVDEVCTMTYDRGFGTFRNTIAQQRALDVGKAKLRVTLGPSCWRDDGEIALDTAKEILIVRDSGFDGWGLFEVDKIVESVLPVLATGPTNDLMGK